MIGILLPGCLVLLPGFGLVNGVASDTAAPLPQEVRAVWDLDKAHRESTATRERICLNGLWQWQPATEARGEVPASNWGYFKVPGSWPGISDYMQKDCQTVFSHPDWKEVRLGQITTAWYQREFEVPAEWAGRRVALKLDHLNSFATVWVDGRSAGELRFPGGELDLTAFCRPGAKHRLNLRVTAMPLKAVMLSYTDTAGARTIQGRVERRGLCGDVWLASTPTGPRISNAKVNTSIRNWQIVFGAALQGLDETGRYRLRAQVLDGKQVVAEFTSQSFTGAGLENGQIEFAADWKPEKLWDTHTPGNMYEASLTLLDSLGTVCDRALPERFGFREFWIEGRDFYLNGSRIFLCAVPLDNAQIGAAWATYDATRESLERLKSFGVNFVYTHNYGCEPGAHLGFEEILRAADDEGMLVSFSQPHFSQYDWKAAEADRNNGYAGHAEFYVRAAQNHPSVVCYSMSHNATGTEESMNPDRIDGISDARNQWSGNNAKLARRAEAIVRALDPGRIVYHHSSGNLGTMHTANFYANFVPVQEMSDWLAHWGTQGVKPLFLCEYGVPISWDWMMYRGWYRGVREFGSAKVPWELCLAEWNAQFFGSEAYKLTDLEKECIRWEARQFRAGQTWHRWDYPRNAVSSPELELRNTIFATYLTENIRAFRTWGISAFCPWDHGIFWKLREGVRRSRKELKVDWDSLQQPGFSADYVDDQMVWMNTSYERSDWLPTAAAHALYRNNLPLLAYIAGKPSAFTSKDHNLNPGETVEKQLVIINNSRRAVTAECSWSLALPEPVSGEKTIAIETGQQLRMPLSFALPGGTPAGRYELTAAVKFSSGEQQTDSFSIAVLARGQAVGSGTRIALFDPQGHTGRMLQELGVHWTAVGADADLSQFDVLIAGRGALTADSEAPDISRVRQGLKVLLFEQSSEALEKRLGFRVEEYGLRSVFKRVPDHRLLAGLSEEHLADWRGEATLLPGKLKYEIGSRHAPEVKWCGMPVTRLWRAGNRGNVASVLIEKPACGDFLPVLDGGFSLQFSPLLEYREGDGLVLFCQMDVTGRTEEDPAAGMLVRNILRYVQDWKRGPQRKVVYAGDPPGMQQLERAGFSACAFQPEELGRTDLLVVGPGGGKQLAVNSSTVAEFADAGGHVACVGLDETEARAFLPVDVSLSAGEHIASFFEPPRASSAFAGISPADVHNRDPRNIPLVVSGAVPVGSGVLAQSPGRNIVFCQLAPWWFGLSEQNNQRRTFRRVSFLLSRLLGNLGASGSTPLLERFHRPADKAEARYLQGLYLDKPEEWDDPYRFFCW